MNNDLASIIIRTTPGRLHFLDQALFSIYGSSYPNIEVVVVVQAEDEGYFQEVEKLSNIYINLGASIKVTRNRTSQDERSKNLNLGIRQAEGRYISFLDDDDVLYPDHISLLIEVIRHSSSTAWAYADVVLGLYDIDAQGNLYLKSRNFHFKREQFSYPDLWTANYIPIHSYIIDRSQIDNRLLSFEESFTALEDYSFLLKLASVHHPVYLPKATCEYRFRLDGSNTNCFVEATLGRELGDKGKIWEIANCQIEQFKQKLLLTLLHEENEGNKEEVAIASIIIERFSNELQQVRAKLEQCQNRVHEIQPKLEQYQNRVHETQAELKRTQDRIWAMESSKFWKLRKLWFQMKQKLGLPTNE